MSAKAKLDSRLHKLAIQIAQLNELSISGAIPPQYHLPNSVNELIVFEAGLSDADYEHITRRADDIIRRALFK